MPKTINSSVEQDSEFLLEDEYFPLPYKPERDKRGRFVRNLLNMPPITEVVQ